ncbi:MAG TPA: DMT family transporter [Gemmatimonadaceae bacterium]|nr:DMT family transporter [Gemmatimonadaceae bacterium]
MASTVADVAAGREDGAATRPGVWVTDLLLFLMAVIWGANFSIVKYGAQALSPLAFNGLRVGVAAVALFATSLAVREPWPARRDALRIAALGTIGNGLYQILFIEGLARTRAGSAALVLAASPAFIALLGWLRGVEQVRPRALLGIAVSFAGVAVVLSGTSGGAGTSGASLVGNLLVLAGCFCWAVFSVGLQPYTRRLHPVHIAALTMAGGAVPVLLTSARAIAATPASALTAGALTAVVYSSIASLVVAYLIWNRGVRVLGPTRTAMYSNLQPVIAVLVAWRFLGEVPTPWQVAGAAGVVSGLLLTRS